MDPCGDPEFELHKHIAEVETIVAKLSLNFNLVESLSSFNFIFNTHPPPQEKFKRPLNINLTIVSTSAISLLKDSKH